MEGEGKGKEKDKRKNPSGNKQKNSYSTKLEKAKKTGFKDKDENKSDKKKNSYKNNKGTNDSSSEKSFKKNKYQGKTLGHGNFPDYMPPQEVLLGLKNKTLIEGVLRINPKSYEDSFISSPEAKDQDIYIKVRFT